MNASSLPASSRLLFDELLARPNLRLRVGEHAVDVGALRIITQPDHPRLTGKAMAVLIELVRHAGETVTREQLFDRVWADRVITPDVLTQAIKELRRAFGDDAKPPRYIETIPRVGYRLLAPIGILTAEEPIVVTGVDEFRANNDPEHGVAIDSSPKMFSARAWVWLLLAAIGLLLIVFVVLARRTPSSAQSQWRVSDLRTLTSDPGYEHRPAISPDGTRFVYAQYDPANNVDRLMMRAIDQTQAVRLTVAGKDFEEMSAWSPDGSQIVFERLGRERCKMFVASILGGTEREVGDCRDYVSNYFDWTPDGKGLITAEGADNMAGNMRLVRWDLGTGVKTPLDYARSADYQDLEGHYSPDGKWIAFRRGLAPYSDLCVMSSAGGAVRQLTQLDSRMRGFAWTQDGAGLVFASNHTGRFALYTVDLDGAHVRPLNISPAEYPVAARTSDRVVYEVPRTTNRLAQFVLGPDKATPELIAKSTGADASPTFSPLGDRIAFVSDRNGSPQIWMYDFASASVNALTDFHDAVLLNPVWHPDATRLLFTVRGADSARLIELELASGRQRVISKPGENVLSGNYGPDPQSYLIVVGASGKHNQLIVLENAGSPAESRRVLAEGVEHMDIDRALSRVYYTLHSRPALFARDLNGGTEVELTTIVQAGQVDGWRVIDGKIWFVSKISWRPSDFMEFDPATGKTRLLGSVDSELRDAGFDVTPARDRIVIVPVGAEDTDVGAFRLTRSN
jgi:Tol biopolymer transport system component/DNA-binding winged helix-turn-helix (wHTH) protein